MEFEIQIDEAAQRLDKIMTARCAGELTRVRVQSLIAQGEVTLNQEVVKQASRKLKEGDIVAFDLPEPVEATPRPQDIPVDVVYEDDDLLVIYKPAGMVVHPGAGNMDGTLVNALLHHCGDSLSGIGGVVRPGIVHRLDKDTSGLMVVAKNDRAHQGLAAQLADRSLSRRYKALVFKVPQPILGVVDQPIGRDPRNRTKMGIGGISPREARTHYKVEQQFGAACALVDCKLESGRTHQIRVHLAHLGHPLIGDPLYGAQVTAVRAALKKEGLEADVIEEILQFPRQALHAWQLSFIHPLRDTRMTFEKELPDDIYKLLNLLA